MALLGLLLLSFLFRVALILAAITAMHLAMAIRSRAPAWGWGPGHGPAVFDQRVDMGQKMTKSTSAQNEFIIAERLSRPCGIIFNPPELNARNQQIVLHLSISQQNPPCKPLRTP